MNALLYWTVWLALSLLAISELGKRGIAKNSREESWAWPASAAGLLLLIIHIVIAMGVRHGWSHQSAFAETARQTNTVYGINWGGGVFVNYLFVVVWLAELIAWRIAPARYGARSPAVTWTIRAFFLVMIINATIVFAGRSHMAAGVIIVGLLVAAWGRRPSA